MNLPKEVIIIGGGKSIQEGISLGLKEKVKKRFVIVCNYAYKHFFHTFLTLIDRDFYLPYNAKNDPEKHPDIYNELKKEPLIVGAYHKDFENFKLPNTILLREKNKTPLTGIFSLKILNLLNFKGTIYLLGFDWNRRNVPIKTGYEPKTDLQLHYYSKEEINHGGHGYIGYYETHDSFLLFNRFLNNNVKIYNVSLNSNINCFNKISYHKMFRLLSNKWYNQDELRKIIKEKLKCIK